MENYYWGRRSGKTTTAMVLSANTLAPILTFSNERKTGF